MSVRMKITHSKTASRRAHHRAGVVRLVRSATGVRCRHCVDPVTGTYRGKQILSVDAPVKAQRAKRAVRPGTEKVSPVKREKAAKKVA